MEFVIIFAKLKSVSKKFKSFNVSSQNLLFFLLLLLSDSKMKHRYFIEISYNGKNYHGWQVQPNAISVQEVLNDCLTKLLITVIKFYHIFNIFETVVYMYVGMTTTYNPLYNYHIYPIISATIIIMSLTTNNNP